jgi:TMEM175 potassium channel family protein
MFLIEFFYSFNCYYATEKNFVDELDKKTIKYLRRSNLILPFLSLIAVGLSFFLYAWSEWIYILIPFLVRIFQKN